VQGSIRSLCVAFVVAVLSHAGPAMADRAPAWLADNPPPEFLRGVGSGPDRDAAVASARTDLCKQLHSIVAAEIRMSDSMTDTNGDVRAEQSTQSVSVIKSFCVFDDLPLRQPRNDVIDGVHWVEVTLARSEYAKFLKSRRTSLAIDPAVSGAQAAAIASHVSRLLAQVGYVVTKGSGDSLPNEARIEFVIDVSEPGQEGMIGGSATATLRLVRSEDKTERVNKSFGPFKEMAFSQSKLQEKLSRKVREAILAERELPLSH
jgi:hypothetical protein